MTESGEKALLPPGLNDILAPEAAHEQAAQQHLIDVFQSHGYDRVKPPLIEFEESLLAGGGKATSQVVFRLMDPVTQRMMGVRADMTMQVARIATTRLRRAARPLRLAYAGQVLRVKGSQLRPERQFAQVGAEIIGYDGPGADAEVIVMAASALTSLGIKAISVDLGMPTLVSALLDDAGLTYPLGEQLRAALDRKDSAAIGALAGDIGAGRAQVLRTMIAASGTAEGALKILAGLDLPEPAARERHRLVQVIDSIRTDAPDLVITVDPVECRGLDYHTGATFAFFAKGAPGELGRGGRYMAGNNGGEPATGLTLFLDAVLRATAPAAMPDRLFIPADVPPGEARRMRAEGWIAVRGLSESTGADEARRLGCTHIFRDGKAAPIGD